MLKEEASNSYSNRRDNLVQSPRKPGWPSKNASIVVEKTTKIASHGSTKVKFDIMMATSLEVSHSLTHMVQRFPFNSSGLHSTATGSCLMEL